MNKIKNNPWTLLSLVFTGVASIIGVVATTKDNDVMKKEIINEVIQELKEKK